MHFSTHLRAKTRTGALARTVGAVLAVALGVAVPLGAFAGAPSAANSPTSNIPLAVPFQCGAGDDVSSACVSSVLQDLDNARSQEGIGPMELPSNYAALTIPEQYLAIFNLERTARGLQAEYGLAGTMDQQAQQGADAAADPPLYATGAYPDAGSIYASSLNPLEADYEFLYDDGWGGSSGATINATCTSPDSSGCWIHRRIILNTQCTTGPCTPVMGAAYSSSASASVFGEYSGGVPPASGMDFLDSSLPYPSTGTPHLFTLSPASGPPGTDLFVHGLFLSGASAVIFGPGCSPSPAVAYQGMLSVTVPSCATGTTYLQATTPQGNTNGLPFTVGSGAPLPWSNPPFVGMAATPDGGGYYLVRSDGTVEVFGDAAPYGGLTGLALNAPIIGIATTPDGRGYWLLGADGGIFSFGDASFHGSTGNLVLEKPVVAMASTPDGQGYWLVARDGGVFAFGDARFLGSMGGTPLNQPVVGMAPDSATGGYWLVAADGGIFSYDAPFEGSTGGMRLNRPVVGMEAAPNGSGYRLVATDGGIFSFRLPFEGSEGGAPLNQPIVGMAADGTTGYLMVAQDGGLFVFGSARFYGSGA